MGHLRSVRCNIFLTSVEPLLLYISGKNTVSMWQSPKDILISLSLSPPRTLQSVRGHSKIVLTVTINGMQEIHPVIYLLLFKLNHNWLIFGSSKMSFLYHTKRRITVGRTTLDECSASRRDLYMITHNTHNRQTSMSPVGFEHTISAGERPETYVLDRAANFDILRTEFEVWHFSVDINNTSTIPLHVLRPRSAEV
jgi:hypothetical protein